MARKNVVGICRMCRRKRRLCKSHYLGAAIHRLAWLPGSAPIMMTPKVIKPTHRQLWAHLLCQVCEGRLNRLGETPVLKLIDNGKDFPLLGMMELVPFGVKRQGDRLIYSGAAMGVRTDALAYYVLGLLWKGAVHRWRTSDEQTTSIDLRGHKDLFRKYLLGQAAHPPAVYVSVTVCEDAGSRGLVYAPARFRGMPHRQFSTLIRGLWFDVIVDKNAPANLLTACCVQSDAKVLFRKNCDHRSREMYRRIQRKAQLAPELAKR
jgi:hypothetical protein